jgi:hypothetical protein
LTAANGRNPATSIPEVCGWALTQIGFSGHAGYRNAKASTAAIGA